MVRQYISKPVNFDRMNEEDMKLLKELKKLEHGQFTEETKMYWRERLGVSINDVKTH